MTNMPESERTPEVLDLAAAMQRLRLARTAETDPEEREIKLQKAERVARDILGARRQTDLDSLFHVDEGLPERDPEAATQLKEQFLREKTDLNIQDTFLLSLREPYFGAIYLTKLASTSHDETDASKTMFSEMRAFVAWMKAEGPLQDVDPYDLNYGASTSIGEDAVNSPNLELEDTEDLNDRWRSGRWMSYEYIGNHESAFNADYDSDRVMITRIRPFANANSVINGASCDIKIYKETVITLPIALFRIILSKFETSGGAVPEYSTGPDGPVNELAMREIEKYMYTEIGADCVQRIDTSIFSAVLPLDNPVQ